MLMTNELPELGDASGAFASRLVVLHLTQSFLGREDLELAIRLTAELPGILRWAIAGWQRLNRRRHFVQPDSAQDALGALRDTSSDMGAFVRDYCEQDPDYSVGVDHLYGAHQRWRKTEGIEGPLTKNRFGTRLRSVCPRVKVSQPRGAKGARGRVYIGIRLTTEAEARLYSPDPATTDESLF
jgi:putative DNA primase/helicase